MSEPTFYEITGVDVFDVGTWNGKAYTDQDLDEMVANFEELSKAGYDFPAKLGHGVQELLDREDLPAAAYVKRLYRRGTKLAADFTRVPQKVKQAIDLGAYRTVSAEIYDTVQLLGKKFHNVLSAIAFLGGDIPAVGTLDDVVALYNHPRPIRLSELHGATRRIVSWTKEEKVTTNAADATVDDEVQELDKELTTLAERAATATKGRAGAPAFRAFLRDTIAKLRGLAKSKTSKNAAADMSLDEMRELVAAAVREQFGSGLDPYAPWITEMYQDAVIVSKDGEYYRIPYTIGDDEAVTLGDPIEVEQVWQPSNEPGEEPGGAIQNRAGNTGKEADMAITKALATALGLPETADEPAVLKAIADLKTESEKFKATGAEISELRKVVTTMKAEATVDAATRERKILPAQRDWALAYAAKDPEGFAAFVKDAPAAIDASERGSATDAPEAQSELAQFQAKVAEKVKGGATVADAQKQVAAEEPELFAAVRARR